MFNIDGKEFRNLEEQVQKNKEDIAKHYNITRVLSDFGIKVLGRFDTYEEIENISEGENYGNAYLIGAEAPYDVYVWTRPDVNAGQPVAYWLNIGPVSIVGPEGPPGKEGEKGATGESTQWYAGRNPGEVVKPRIGDMYLHIGNGTVYRYQQSSSFLPPDWFLRTSIMGPQGVQGPIGLQGEPGVPGPQGPKGERGDVGGFINIWGILASADQLPTPQSLDNLTVAYLVEHTGGSDAANDHYDLYIQVGENSDVATWNNVGPFNAATLVTVNGEGQNVWNADTKLDKYTDITEYNQVYVKAASGGEGTINVTKQTLGDAVVQRQSDGHILVPTDPVKSSEAASKYYVDTQLATKVGFEDYANINKAGVIKLANSVNGSKPGVGLSINKNGEMYLSNSTEYMIQHPTRYYAPVMSDNLYRWIKQGVAYNDQTLSEEEKASACDWLGAVNLEYLQGVIASLQAQIDELKQA